MQLRLVADSTILALTALLLTVLILIGSLIKLEAQGGEYGLCTVGLFAGPGGGFIVITRAGDGYEYAFDTGIAGRIGSPRAEVTCHGDTVRVRDSETWTRVSLREKETTFQSRGITLVGRLVEPPETVVPGPLVVFARGSEQTGWLDRVRDPYQLVGRGISVFVYDKRGTGRSGGVYNQNFLLLAEDLVAASKEARRLAGDRFARFGLIGLSQGGWVAPLAANRVNADFLAIGYGLVMDIREEDAAQVALELREAGYGPGVLDNARKITDATARLVTEASRSSVLAFDDVRNRFSNETWSDDIRGDYTGILMNADVDEILDTILPSFQSYGVDWSVDPVEAVRRVDAPQLWVFARDDRSAPGAVSIERLISLRDAGHDIQIMEFPNTDHGMWEFKQANDGSRAYTRVTTGYYDMLADWAYGRLGAKYGASEQR